MDPDAKRFTKFILLGLFLAFGGLTFFGSVTTVEEGYRGVRIRFGEAMPGVMMPGFHFKAPFIDSITQIEVREQKLEINTNASSKDLQEVQTSIVLNFHPFPEVVDKLFSKNGLKYQTIVLGPATEDVVKEVTSQYTAEELITLRNEVSRKMLSALRDRVRVNNIEITAFNIVNFDFSATFNAAIEAKQTAEQEALRAENDLRRIEIEAKQSVEQARGRAESVKLEAAAKAKAITMIAIAEAEAQEVLAKVVTSEVLRLRAIEKWDGIMPRFTGGGAIPFIDITSTDK